MLFLTNLVTAQKGVEIHKNVEPINGEKVIIKHFPNSFRETELLETPKIKGRKVGYLWNDDEHVCRCNGQSKQRFWF